MLFFSFLSSFATNNKLKYNLNYIFIAYIGVRYAFLANGNNDDTILFFISAILTTFILTSLLTYRQI